MGGCRVWAPGYRQPKRIDGPREAYAAFGFPLTHASYFCGDGISLTYEDPDDL